MTQLDKEKAENLRQLRREAHRQMKEKQKTNPTFIAMKEAQKKMRRKAYEYAKERAKKLRDAAKAAKKETIGKINDDRRAEKDKELMACMISAETLLNRVAGIELLIPGAHAFKNVI